MQQITETFGSTLPPPPVIKVVLLYYSTLLCNKIARNKILYIINCSQTKFVAIILVLSVFFYAIFSLTDFSSDAFDFSSSKTGLTGSAQRTLSALRAFQLTSLQVWDSLKRFWRLILMVWRVVPLTSPQPTSA